MRERADRRRIGRFLRELGGELANDATCYLSGGATAVLLGWRASTIDIDVRLEPERDELLRRIPELKDRLHLNVELASPLDFIPEPPDWRERSPFVAQEGRLAVRHLDPYAQALAKIERDHDLDRADVRAMLDTGLVDPARLAELFAAIEPQLYRFPAIAPQSFRARLRRTIAPTITPT